MPPCWEQCLCLAAGCWEQCRGRRAAAAGSPAPPPGCRSGGTAVDGSYAQMQQPSGRAGGVVNGQSAPGAALGVYKVRACSLLAQLGHSAEAALPQCLPFPAADFAQSRARPCVPPGLPHAGELSQHQQSPPWRC